MTFPLQQKLPMLLDFHNILEQEGWNIKGTHRVPIPLLHCHPDL
jgi:hypothetical protein